jgi:hypothetical protein
MTATKPLAIPDADFHMNRIRIQLKDPSFVHSFVADRNMSQDFISWVVSVFLERSRSEVV